MEALIRNIRVMVAVFLPLVSVLVMVTNIIVEVLKKLTRGKLPANILAFVVAMAVTLLAFFAVCQIVGIAVVWYMAVGAVIMGIFVAYAAIFGFDKMRQTIGQISSIEIFMTLFYLYDIVGL